MTHPETIRLSRNVQSAIVDFSHAVLDRADPLAVLLQSEGLEAAEIASVIAQALLRTGCKLACTARREILQGAPDKALWMHAADLAWQAINPADQEPA